MNTTEHVETKSIRPTSSAAMTFRPHFQMGKTAVEKEAIEPRERSTPGAQPPGLDAPGSARYRVDAAHARRVPPPHLSFANTYDPEEYEGWTVQDISFGLSSNVPEVAAGSSWLRPETPPVPSSMRGSVTSSRQDATIARSVTQPGAPPNSESQIPAAHRSSAQATNWPTAIEAAVDSWTARSRAQIVGFDMADQLAREPAVGIEPERAVVIEREPRVGAGESMRDKLSPRVSGESVENDVGENPATPVDLELATPLWPEMTDRLLLAALPYLRQMGAAMIKDQIKSARWLVSSSERGAGATTLGLSLARWLISQGQRVLLVDADFHRAGLSRSLAFDGGFSWLGGLRRGRSLREMLVRFRELPLGLLPLAAVRNRSLWPANLLDRLSEQLSELSRDFDQVLLDVGPLSQWASETQQLSQVAQRCLLVVRKAGSDPEQLQQTQLRLNGLGIQQLLIANITPSLAKLA